MQHAASITPVRGRAHVRSPEQDNASPEQIVYVLDPNPDVRSTIRQWLTASGYHVCSFEHPEALLSINIPRGLSCLILEHSSGISQAGMKVLRLYTEDSAASVIVLGDATDLSAAVRAIRSGATEFIPKPIAPDLLLLAVQRAFDEVRCRWVDTCRNRDLKSRYATLTPREREILPYVVTGYLNKETAYRLGTSEVTIRIHRGQIMRKMAADSLADLVKSAVRIGVAEL